MDLRVDVRGGGGSGEAAFGLLIEHWIGDLPERRAILEPVREQLSGLALPMAEEEVEVAFGPVRTVLERGMDGIPITASGAFKPEFACELARSHPGWAGIEASCITREADLPMLRNLRATLLDCGHLRLDEAVAFSRAESADLARDEPIAAMIMLGCDLVRDQGFLGDSAELTAALMLAGEPLEAEHLAQQIHPAMAERWSMGGAPAVLEAVHIAVSLWMEHAQAIGTLPDPWAPSLRGSRRWPGPAGEIARACQMAMLRYRVVRFVERGGDGDGWEEY